MSDPAADVAPHWTSHVVVDERGELSEWRDHPGCHYCNALAGRLVHRAD